MTIDTQAFTKHLTEKGHFKQEQAEAIVEAQRDHLVSDLATKGDIKAILNRFDVFDQHTKILYHELSAKISHQLLIMAGVIIATVGLFTKVL